MNGHSLKVGKQNILAEDGETILNALVRNGIEIPHICYQPNLGPIQTCDSCIVGLGDGSFVRSCSHEIRSDLDVDVSSNESIRRRQEAVQRILRNHELYCTLCENNNGDCQLHNAVRDLKINRQEYPFEPKPYQVDSSNPFYVYDPNQCILCGRCVEACQDVQVNETIHIDWSLERPRVIWDEGVAAGESSCVSCGHCVTVCPVNALMEKEMLGKAGLITSLDLSTKKKMIQIVKKAEPLLGMAPVMKISEIESRMRGPSIRKTKTVCTYCGVGCSFDMWTKGREILKVQPRPESPANGISTCVKGKFGWGFVNSQDRLTTPLIKKEGEFVPASWDEAIRVVSNRLKSIKERYGGDSIMVISSSKGTNEESYLFQKLARQVLGTNNVDNSSRFCQAPATIGLWRTVGYGGDSGSISDIYSAGLVITVGSNTAESHPVLATRVKRAHKLNGQKLIVADIRDHEMARRADLVLHPKPGTDLIWLSAVTKYIIDQGWQDNKFLEERVNGYEEYKRSLDTFTLDYAEKMTGIGKNYLIKTAEMIHESRGTCILWAMGVTQGNQGSDTSTAISNLLLVTGNYGKNGTGAYPLRGHNNVQGTSDFGSMDAFLPGYQKVTDPDVRIKFEKAWNCSLPDKPGLNNNSCLEGIMEDKIRGMLVVGEELVLTGADSGYISRALEKLEFLAVIDPFFTETAKFADVVLPSAVSVEKDGTFVNTERRVQRIYRVMDPLPGTRPDWQIAISIARELGTNWNYSHPSEIMDEISSLAPMFAGVNYKRLEGYRSLQWPVAPDGKDSPLLYTEKFNFPDGKAVLYQVGWDGRLDVNEDYDLYLNSGRLLEHFHEGNETYRTEGIKKISPTTFLEVPPELAAKRGIESGDTIRVTSRWGSLKTKALVTDRVSGKELYMPMNDSGDQAVNILTGRIWDEDSGTPSYKDIPVRIEKIQGEKSSSPLPRNNFRWGKPRPQKGVMVEEKWKREDYIPLTKHEGKR